MTLATDQDADGFGLSATARRFQALRDAIMQRWEHEVRMRIPGARTIRSPILTNTLPAFIDNIAEALSSRHPRDNATSDNNAAAVHGSERARMTSLKPAEVIHEYQILRESIIAVTSGRMPLTPAQQAIVDRSIDSAVREAIEEFTTIQDDLRRKLAAALSHDMRTPLAVVLNGAELIRLTPDQATAHQVAGRIVSNAKRIEQMMVDLLDALTDRVDDQPALALSHFDIAELVEEVCGNYLASQGIDMRLRLEPVQGYWCRNALQRALENLINNAAAYGDGGTVAIMSARSHGRMLLSVHNTGSTIPKTRHREIFEYFMRGDAVPARAGWGLGLPFVKKVAEGHGGSVAVDSAPASGTTFLIDIPVDCRPYVAGAAGGA